MTPESALATVTPMDAALLVGLLVASVSDVLTMRIPNWLTLSLIVVGLLLNAVSGTLMGAIFGLLAAFGLHFLLWSLKVQKGGDAKLMMGVGALVGASQMVETTFWKLILLVPIGLVMLAVRGKLGNVRLTMRYTLARARGAEVGEPPPVTYMPFAPVIALAWLVARLTDVLELW
jgi:Flp pilus assembly protein protease CpaA